MCSTNRARCYFAVFFCRFSVFLTVFNSFFLFSHGIECFLVPFFVSNRKIGRYNGFSCRMWHMCYNTPVRCYFAVVFVGFSICSLSLSISHAKEWFSVCFFVFDRKIAQFMRCGCYTRHTCAASPSYGAILPLSFFVTLLAHSNMF